jgi:hypothetical protein
MRAASEKLKNQPRPLLRPRSVHFRQHFWNLSHETVPLTYIFSQHFACVKPEFSWRPLSTSIFFLLQTREEGCGGGEGVERICALRVGLVGYKNLTFGWDWKRKFWCENKLPNKVDTVQDEYGTIYQSYVIPVWRLIVISEFSLTKE